ncbi:MAG: alanyl-tRNA editing protein [Alphaproteobacteria bacterium]
MSELLFRDDAYARTCTATVTAVTTDERGGRAVRLDRTVFYPTGGGQPGDSGRLVLADGTACPVATTIKGERPDDVLHILAADAPAPAAGDTVTAELDWDRRHRHMRMHTCLHLLSALLPYPVTGGQIAADKARMDLDIAEAILDKAELTAQLNALIERDARVSARWISDEELAANPDLVKTMAVKPPTGSGRVRLIEVEGQDLQPCGGTHLRRTGEIGRVIVTRIEKKGRQNRRVAIAFDEAVTSP